MAALPHSCLIVDDSRVVRKVLRTILEDHGFSVISEAENGREALDACISSMPDIIFLDWNMPVMSGIDFMKELEGIRGGSATKVLFCTTENDCTKIMQAIEAGADEYIMKPFNADTVRDKLEIVGVSVAGAA